MSRSLLFRFGAPLAVPVVLAAALTCVLAWSSCATYRQDLDRARNHYEANRYEQALALFRVLEPDMDSFSEAEKIQYAYFRGMTDYRLASLANAGSSVTDPKKGFRDNAHHWLAIASAIEKKTPGGLTEEQKQRLGDAMGDLNRDVFGGAEALADVDGGAPEAGSPAPAMPPQSAPPRAAP
jgi:hypothetical protein